MDKNRVHTKKKRHIWLWGLLLCVAVSFVACTPFDASTDEKTDTAPAEADQDVGSADAAVSDADLMNLLGATKEEVYAAAGEPLMGMTEGDTWHYMNDYNEVVLSFSFMSSDYPLVGIGGTVFQIRIQENYTGSWDIFGCNMADTDESFIEKMEKRGIEVDISEDAEVRAIGADFEYNNRSCTFARRTYENGVTYSLQWNFPLDIADRYSW